MIDVSALKTHEWGAASVLFEKTSKQIPYRWDLTPQQFKEHVLFADGGFDYHINPDTQGWIIAQEDDRPLGFAHCSVGYLKSDSKGRPQGYLRYLSSLPDAPGWVPKLLLAKADNYFRSQQVAQINAFHNSIGYSCLAAGRGAFVSSRVDLMAALSDAGYRIRDRWLLYERQIKTYFREYLPTMEGLNLQIVDEDGKGFLFYLTERTQPVAELTVDFLHDLTQHSQIHTASLRRLEVQQALRRQGNGRWLMLRALNELRARGYRRLVVDINHSNLAAQSLLRLVGFEELQERGYSYTKTLNLR